MCNRVAIELALINGQKACYDCRRAIRKGRAIKRFERGKEDGKDI